MCYLIRKEDMWELIFVSILLGYIVFQHRDIKRLKKQNDEWRYKTHDVEI